MVEQCLLAEQMGFDTIWCVEHTALTNYAHMGAPETPSRSSPGAPPVSASATVWCAYHRR